MFKEFFEISVDKVSGKISFIVVDFLKRLKKDVVNLPVSSCVSKKEVLIIEFLIVKRKYMNVSVTIHIFNHYFPCRIIQWIISCMNCL